METNIMKIGVVFFHKNATKICSRKWIDQCVNSIKHQTYNELNFYEINYGSDSHKFVEGSTFFNKKLKNHAEAMNFIIDQAFEDGCDYVFNTNIDDFYERSRVQEQLKVLKKGYDIVSSDFFEVNEESEITAYRNMSGHGSIFGNLMIDHNVIGHPGVAYSKNFWQNPFNRYGINDIPEEDLLLWKQAITSGYKFKIINEPLFSYRRHENQICKPNNEHDEDNFGKLSVEDAIEEKINVGFKF